MAAKRYPLTLLYDGACPMCRLEMDRLRERDGLRRLAFVDVSAPGFDASIYTAEATAQDMLELIHAVGPDGRLAVGVDALRLAYEAVGLGALWLPAQLPLLRPGLDAAYALLARNRYAVSQWLMPLLVRIEARRATRRTSACAAGSCEVPQDRRSS